VAKAEFQLTIGALDRFTRPFQAYATAVENATAGMRRFGNELQVATRRIGTALGLPKLGKALKDIGGGFQKVGGAAKDAAKRLGGVALAAGGAVFAGYKLVRLFTDTGVAAAKSAQRAGITAEAWQEMAYVAGLSDVSNEQLLDSYKKLNVAMKSAETGGQAQADAFKTLGVTLKNSKGQLKASDEVMLEVADALSKLPEGINKSALAMAIFGESGTNLLPMLNSGKAGIMDMRREANSLGLVMGSDAAKASEEFNDNVTKLQSRFKGLGMMVGGALLPAFKDLVQMFSELIDENKELIKTKVTEYADKIKNNIPKIKKTIKDIVSYIPKAIEIFEGLVERFGFMKVAGVGLAALLGGPFIVAMGGFISMIAPLGSLFLSIYGPMKVLFFGFFKFLGLFSGYAQIFLMAIKIILKAILFNPFGLLLTAVVVAMKAIFWYFGGFDNWLKLFKEGLALIGSDIKAFATTIWDGIGAAFEWLLELLEPVINLFKKIGSTIKEFLTPVIDKAKKELEPLLGMFDKVASFFGFGDDGEKSSSGDKKDDQLTEEELQKQRFEMLDKKNKGEITNAQFREYMTRSYNINKKFGAEQPAGSTLPGPPAMEGLPMAGGSTQKTEHTEVQKQDVTLTLNIPPGSTLSGTTGPVPNNVHVGGRAAALGSANG
jgi:polyhydroxyalkanoate synthesis regulator protein